HEGARARPPGSRPARDQDELDLPGFSPDGPEGRLDLRLRRAARPSLAGAPGDDVSQDRTAQVRPSRAARGRRRRLSGAADHRGAPRAPVGSRNDRAYPQAPPRLLGPFGALLPSLAALQLPDALPG